MVNMSLLQGSLNFVWSTSKCLGTGATATVYQGINKSNGDQVAVKTFKSIMDRVPSVQIREISVLQKLNHKHIVKMLAIEANLQTGQKVIVMELCTGGSLLSILLEPENFCGLPETEVLTVLDHLTSGINYLRENNIVHRDLKPGNIMKYIGDDGLPVYKLIDFGAARELSNGQEFLSLCGTEEYLHPDVYEQAFLNQQTNRTFGATVDLWSIGVTLYHVATGSLPFRHYSGRENKEAIHYIITKKPSNAISGVCVNSNGQIEWSETLPDSCQLSTSLQFFFTPLLVGLLEANSKKIWTFDKFFLEVTKLLSRKVIHVFYVNNGQPLRIFIRSTDSYEKFQKDLEILSLVNKQNQLLLSDLFYTHDKDIGLFSTAEENPIFLLNKDDCTVKALKEDQPEFLNFIDSINLQNDEQLAKKICEIAYLKMRKIEKYAASCKQFNNFVQILNKQIKSELMLLHQEVNFLLEKNITLKNMLQLIQKVHPNLIYLPKLKDVSEQFISKHAKEIVQFYEAYKRNDTLVKDWQTGKPIKQIFSNGTLTRAKTEVEKLKKSWRYLLKNQQNYGLSHDDVKYHNLEKIKITNTSKRLDDLYLQEVLSHYEQMIVAFGDWYCKAQKVYITMKILKENVKTYRQNLQHFEQNLVIDEQSIGQVENIKEDSVGNNTAKGFETFQCLFDEYKNNIDNMDTNRLLQTNDLIKLRYDQLLKNIFIDFI